jgi:steroid delta-isomerase-like uncharacterized protein
MKMLALTAALLMLGTPALAADPAPASAAAAPVAEQLDPRILLATDLFLAWSSGNADAPAAYLSEDAVLEDIVGGKFEGWPAIRKFFADGVAKWPDLKLVPTAFWISDDGVALTWEMTATQVGPEFGPDAVGKVWKSPGMSYLVIRNGKVVKEVDYHDRFNVPLSLGVDPGKAGAKLVD